MIIKDLGIDISLVLFTYWVKSECHLSNNSDLEYIHMCRRKEEKYLLGVLSSLAMFSLVHTFSAVREPMLNSTHG